MKTLELYILSKADLSILSVCQPCSYNINSDEETNGKSTFILPALNYAKKGYYVVLNGLYKQFIFIIDDVITNKGEKTVSIVTLDISNIFDRKVIAKNLDTMLSSSLEDFIANTMLENFINSTDSILNISYIDIYKHTNTLINEPTNDENGLYNFRTFLTNCRQHQNICCDFKFENRRLKIDIENKIESTVLIDTTVKEVTDYNKIYDVDPVTKVQVYIRENNAEYNLYLRNDRTTTIDKNDLNRAKGRIEVISVETTDKAYEEALNVIKGNTYKHLVEFKISKSSKLVDVSNLKIGTLIKIKTEDDVYDSYISAIVINNNDNFIYYKSGSLRISLLDKLKQEKSDSIGNKLDISGGKINGDLKIAGGTLEVDDIKIATELTKEVSGTEVILDNASEYKLLSLAIEGSSTQVQTVASKNICPTNINDWESGHYGVTGIKESYTTRIRVKKLIKILPSTTYYFNTNSTYNFVGRMYNSEGTFIRSVGSLGTSTTLISTSNEYYISISLYLTDITETFVSFTTLFNNGTIKPFVCLNSENDKTYTSYIPVSPSFDYPSSILNVGDTGTINLWRHSKNIWNKNFEIAEYNDSGIKVTTTVWLVNTLPIQVNKNTQYTISQRETPSQYRIIYFNNGTYISRENNIQDIIVGYKTYTFITPENCTHVYIQFRSTLERIAQGSYLPIISDITNTQLELRHRYNI